MILSFSVANFRSFGDEVTFSMVASNRLTEHPDHLVDMPDSNERALRAGVLYGANGAGKSNLFQALSYLRRMAVEPRQRNSGTGRQAFKFGDFEGRSSDFDLQFVVDDVVFRYGFKVDDTRVLEEWLIVQSGAREKVLFERITKDDDEVEVDLGTGQGKKLEAMATVGGLPNQTFLATVRTNLEESEDTGELGRVLVWLDKFFKLISPAENMMPISHSLHRIPGFLEFAKSFMQNASTGIDHFEIQREEVCEPGKIKKVSTREFNYALEGDTLYELKVMAGHALENGNFILMDMEDESDGTRRLLELLLVLFLAKTGEGVFVIDEIDRSMHPILVRHFMEYFLKTCKGKGQVIVTTHESNLLDLELLRRDEIWFAEKDDKGETNLYSLVDFKVRKDLSIQKHYLEGRFGAIPFVGDLEKMMQPAGETP